MANQLGEYFDNSIEPLDSLLARIYEHLRLCLHSFANESHLDSVFLAVKFKGQHFKPLDV